MQKVIAFSIDVNQLVSRSDETFSIAEPEMLNELLQEGWEIEDWSFLTDDPVNGKMPMLVVLNDDLMVTGGEEEIWEEEDAYLDEDGVVPDDIEDDDELDKE
jgi:hypothetical protein